MVLGAKSAIVGTSPSRAEAPPLGNQCDSDPNIILHVYGRKLHHGFTCTCIYKSYKTCVALELLYFRTVKAIGLLFSTLHTTPLLCAVKVYFGVLHKHSVDVTRSDTSWGSKPPQLQVGTFKSHQFRCIEGSCRY